MADVKISQLPAATTPVSGTEELPLVQSGVTKKIALSDLSSISFGATGLTPATATSGAVVVAGTLDVNNGGTGLATLTANNVILGNGTSTPTFVAPSTSGNVLTSNGTTWVSSVPATSGTVTSVNVSGGTTGLTTSGGPITTSGVITLAGTLDVDNGGTGLTAGTSGGVLAYTATGTLASSAALTQYGVVYGGGAGAVPVATAAGTTGQVLTATTSGAPSWAAPATSGTVTSVAMTVPSVLSISGSPITSSGTLALTYSGTALPVANGGTGVTTSTGTTNVVLSNSPTLVTPDLGSPSSVGTMPAFTLGGTVSGGGNQINNVVIGTLSPLAGAFTTVSASTSVTTPSVMTSGATALLLRPNGVTRMTIGTDGDPITTAVPLAVTGTLSSTLGANFATSSGSVGVGTASPQALLHVGAVAEAPGFGTTSQMCYVNGTSQPEVLIRETTNDVVVSMYADSTSGSIRTATNHPLVFFTDNTERARINAAGGLAVTGTLSATGTLSGGTSGTGYSFSGSAPATSLTLDASGNLGIGTSSPGAKLHVVGSSGSGSVQIGTSAGANQYQLINFGGNVGGTDYGWQVGRSSNTSGLGGDGAFYFYDIFANTTRMSINNAGNLGLGVTPSAWVDYKAIQLGGGAIASYTGNAFFECMQNTFWDGANKYVNNGFASSYQQTSGQHRWNTAASGTAGNAISFTQAMTLDASGNLGIGTTSPSFRLHAVSSAAVVSRIGSSGGSGAFINFIDSGASPSVAPSVGAIGNNLVFMGDGSATERARIDSSGNLLVGGVTTTTGFAVIKGVTYGESYISINHPTNTPSSYGYADFLYNGGLIGNITQNGTTAVSYNTTSDYRLKNTIASMTGALAKVALLKPCTYKWNADGSDGQGFIAHELAEVVPQCVTGEKDAVNEDGSIKSQGIDTSFLVATLTAAIQEQQALITQLTARITALETA